MIRKGRCGNTFGMISKLSSSKSTLALGLSCLSFVALEAGCGLNYAAEDGRIIYCDPVDLDPLTEEQLEVHMNQGVGNICMNTNILGGIYYESMQSACAQVYNNEYGITGFQPDDFDATYEHEVVEGCHLDTHDNPVVELENPPGNSVNAARCIFDDEVVLLDNSGVTPGTHTVQSTVVCTDTPYPWGGYYPDDEAELKDTCRERCQLTVDDLESQGWELISETDCQSVEISVSGTYDQACSWGDMGGSSFASLVGIGFDNTYNALNQYAWGAMASDTSHCQRGQTCNPTLFMSYAADDLTLSYQSEVMLHSIELSGLRLDMARPAHTKTDASGAMVLEDAQYILSIESVLFDGVEMGPLNASEIVTPSVTIDASGNILVSGSIPLLGGQLDFAQMGYPAYPATPPQ